MVGLALFWIPLLGVHLDQVNGYGLISVIPIATMAGALLLTVAFMLSLALSRPHRWLLAVQLVAAVISLHGIAAAVEPLARDPTAWQHAGFVEYIARSGAVDARPTVAGGDPRFLWPGFFALATFLTKATGIHNIEPLLHWAAVANELLYLVPLMLILRALKLNWRATWLAAWFFMVADWVGQDYFSPQGFALLLYLSFIAILVNWFRPPGKLRPWKPPSAGRRAHLVHNVVVGERDPAPAATPDKVALFLLLVLMFAVVTASHQVTPYMILFVTAGLILVRRCTLVTLPILLGVMVVFWVSFMTVAYWKGNQTDLFSGLGNFFGNLNSGVSGRIATSSPELAAIQRWRVYLAMAALGLAFFGAMRRRLWRIDDRIPLVLLFAPVLSMGLQNYGGEITLRVYFFALAGACVFMACAFFPTPFAFRSWRALTAATVITAFFVGGFLFVRFGNEASQQVLPQDVQALQVTTEKAQPGRIINIVWLTAPDSPEATPQMPWGFTSMERFTYIQVAAAKNPNDLNDVITQMQQAPGSFFVTTRVHDAYLHYNYGVSEDYLVKRRAALDSSPQLTAIYQTPEAATYVLRNPPAGEVAAPVPPRVPFGIGHTTLTPVGLATVVLLMVLLIGYELRKLIRPATAPSVGAGAGSLRSRLVRMALRPFPIIVFCLLADLAMVVIERFTVLQ